jgi:hypothetical protein
VCCGRGGLAATGGLAARGSNNGRSSGSGGGKAISQWYHQYGEKGAQQATLKLWPLVIGQDQQAWTVQVALSTFITAQSINMHELFMAAAVSILPLVLVFVFLQRRLVQGVAQTGIKG